MTRQSETINGEDLHVEKANGFYKINGLGVVPFVTYEALGCRLDRINKRLTLALIGAVALFAAAAAVCLQRKEGER